jgi:hypothetical protein
MEELLQSLIAESRSILADFLRADLKLGMTFAQLAQTEAAYGDTQHATDAHNHAARAVATAERFLPSLVGINEDRTQIESDLKKLRSRIAELQRES